MTANLFASASEKKFNTSSVLSCTVSSLTVAHRVGEQLLGLSDRSVKGDARAGHVATDVTIVIVKV